MSRFNWLLILLVLSSCIRNPVTGNRELALIPVSVEKTLGADNFEPMTQVEGGKLIALPAVSQYVNRVGQKLAEVSDRKDLPFEFIVLNNSVPNAWTLPGGKIAVNRGLLAELKSESELAAVLSHEIVHAAARHGVKSVERGLLLKAGLSAISAKAKDHDYEDLIIGASAIGFQLVHFKYSRKAEFEADCYGIKYMSKAGYDVKAAVRLQEMFLKLTDQKKAGWIDGLFATHPPSEERLRANQAALADYPEGGFEGKDEYKENMASLFQSKPYYDKIDEGYKAFNKKDFKKALKLAEEALHGVPNEAEAYALIAKAQLALDDKRSALRSFIQAIQLNDQYFDYFQARGLLYYSLKEPKKAREDLERSLQLLETAESHYYLGLLDSVEGNQERAIAHFTAASESDSEIGKKAQEELKKRFNR